MSMGDENRRCVIGMGRDGAVYVLAIVTLVVGTILVLALMRSSVAGFMNQSSLEDKQAARNMAWAGVDYGYWQVAHQGQGVPYTANVTLNTGTFQASIADNGAATPGTVLITSTGTVGAYQETVKRVMQVSAGSSALPYDYAWCQDSNLSCSKDITMTGGSPGIHANGNISLSSSGNVISSGVSATGTITCSGSVSPQSPNSLAVSFPAIDPAYYNSIATRVYSGNTTLDVSTLAQGVYVVNGNLTLSGAHTYNGMITLVVTGSISVNGNVTEANSDAYLALISPGGVNLNALTIHAVIYCHNGTTGVIALDHKLNEFAGCLAADSVNATKWIVANRDSRVTRDIMTQMHLPGTY